MMGLRLDTHVQDCGSAGGQTVVWSADRAAQIAPFAAQGLITCPRCKRVLRMGSEGFIHEGQGEQAVDHPPLDWAWHRHVEAVHDRLARIFPSAQIARYHRVGDEIVELVMLTSQGGKLGVLIPGSTEDHQRLAQLHALMIQHAVRPLIMVPDHLVELTRPQRSKTERVKLDNLALAVLSLGEPLWLIRPNRRIVNVIAHPDSQPLWAQGKSLGVVEAVAREYPISQLRLSSGMMAVLNEWDPELPAFKPLPARLLKRL